MIELINNLPSIKTNGVAFAKISCLAKAYIKNPNIALFWQQKSENDRVDALISMLDGNMCIFSNQPNILELKEFITVLSPKSIFTDIKTANLLNLKIKNTCHSLCFKTDKNCEIVFKNNFSEIKAVYTRLIHDNSFDFTDFYADISHRIRHNCGGYILTDTAACIAFFDSKYAVINGIEVDEKYRNTGHGTWILKEMLKKLPDRQIFVCSEEKNIPFYIKNNFTPLGKFAYCGV